MLQYRVYNIKDNKESWKEHLDKLISVLDHVYNGATVKITGILMLRQTINDILLTNISCNKIISELLTQLINKHPQYEYDLMSRLIKVFYTYDQRISTGTRQIIHIEQMFIHLCKILYEYRVENKK